MFHIGQQVQALRTKDSAVAECVVVAVDEQTGVPAIARLRKDGTVRQECIWTGLWYAVVRREV